MYFIHGNLRYILLLLTFICKQIDSKDCETGDFKTVAILRNRILHYVKCNFWLHTIIVNQQVVVESLLMNTSYNGRLRTTDNCFRPKHSMTKDVTSIQRTFPYNGQ